MSLKNSSKQASRGFGESFVTPGGFEITEFTTLHGAYFVEYLSFTGPGLMLLCFGLLTFIILARVLRCQFVSECTSCAWGFEF